MSLSTLMMIVLVLLALVFLLGIVILIYAIIEDLYHRQRDTDNDK